MITDYLPAFSVERKPNSPDAKSEVFHICSLPKKGTPSLTDYSRRIYAVVSSADFIFVPTSFMKTWWERMPEDLKEEVRAIRQSADEATGRFIISSEDIEPDFLRDATFENIQFS